MDAGFSTHEGDNKHTNYGRKTRREETTWKPRRRWEDDIRMDLREIGSG